LEVLVAYQDACKNDRIAAFVSRLARSAACHSFLPCCAGVDIVQPFHCNTADEKPRYQNQTKKLAIFD
jgi:hypothetical protein